MDVNTTVETVQQTQNGSPVWWILGAVALVAVGYFAIPPLLKKYSNKLYKSSAKKDSIDFDKLGPEIVKRNTETKKEK